MSLAAHHPLHGVKAMLSEIARDGDRQRLASLLSGESLPALGNELHPAQVIQRALSLSPFEAELVRAVSELLAELCEQRARVLADELENSQELPKLADEVYVFNLFLLASYLPATPALFRALKSFHDVGLGSMVLSTAGGRAARQLRQALIYQQTDASLEEYWLDLMSQRPRAGVALDSGQKADLLDAWTGLLWIPSTPADRDDGRPLSVERVATGLRALYEAVEGSAEGLSILSYALRHLDEAYPRSPEFWAEVLRPHLTEWPQGLQDMVAARWSLSERSKERGLTGFSTTGRLSEIVEVLVNRGVTLAQARQEFERQFIVASLRFHDGSIGRTARSLGIHRNSLRGKVANLGISVCGRDRPSRRTAQQDK